MNKRVMQGAAAVAVAAAHRAAEEQVLVQLPKPVVDLAVHVAAQMTGRTPNSYAGALAVCIESASGPSMQRIADAVNARQKAVAIMMTMGVVQALTGQDVELVEAPDDEWFLRFRQSGQGVSVGKCAPDLLRRELEKAGGEIRSH